MLQSVLCLGAGWLLYRLALRQERCFGYNRCYLLLLPVLAAVLPLLQLPAPWRAASGGIFEGAVVYLPAVVVGGEVTMWSMSWVPWLGFVYGLGVAGWLGRLGWELVSLWRMTHRLPREARAGYVLVRTGGLVPTSSFGKRVFWDETADLTPAEAHQILRHELAHVRQGHTWERLALEVLRAVLWFNPFAHLLPRALELTHEYLADEEVLRDIAAPAYAALLARQAATRLGFTSILTHSFVQSFTLNRIAMLYRKSPGRRWKQWLSLPLAALLMLIVACEHNTELVAPTKRASSQEVVLLSDFDAEPAFPIAIPYTTYGELYAYEKKMSSLPTPLFPTGNNNDITAFLQSKLQYPAEAKRNKVQGSVAVAFTVGKDGKVTDAHIKEGLGAGCDEAALQAVQQLPRFIPGKQDGHPVAGGFIIFIQFNL